MALLPQCQVAAVSAIPNAKQRGVLMHPPIYKHALAALSIRHVEIRHDYLAGVWIEAVANFRTGGLAERDVERRADRLIEQVFEAMDNGTAWLRQRIALCERAA